ncbi:PAS domain S-box-containing protein [Rubrivivax gelatinosus]|nr:PAS domain-containing protein [Rubrivivax gelatinosus]MBG6082210.1 PAS domain S-box-containing protein [Rubrivivax gelatinosus]
MARDGELAAMIPLLWRSLQPMALLLGPRRVLVYNDAFAPLCGDSHPRCFGLPFETASSPQAPALDPMIRAGYAGEARAPQRLPWELRRDGLRTRTTVDLSVTPLLGDAGGVAAVLLVAHPHALAPDGDDRASAPTVDDAARSAALLRAVSDASPDVIFAKDLEGRLLLANPATLALIGKPAHEVLGRTDRELLQDPAAAEAVMRNDRRIMESGIAEEIEEVVPRPDGRPVVWLSRKMPWRREGQVAGLLGISRDITERKRLEQQLAASNDSLNQILGSITDGFAFLDQAWRYTYFSEQGARMFGLRREDVLGRCLWDLFPHAATSRFGAEYRRAMDSGEPVHFEAFYPEPLNSWIECHCYPSREGLAVFFRDVTKSHEVQAALRESEDRLRRIFEASPIGMVTGDESGRILGANSAYLRLLGRSSAELDAGALRWDEVTPPEHLDADRHAIAEVARDGVSRIYEKEYLHAAGHRVPVLVACARLSGDGRLLVGFVIDISERKRAERILAQADQNKNHFIAMLAHELRNPLATIQHGVSMLQRHAAADLSERVLGIMDRQIRHIVRLTEDLLDVSRIGSGKLELRMETVDLREVVHAAVEAARSLLEQAGHRLTLDLPAEGCHVHADHARLVQVVSNLLSNAARYTPPGGRIEVRLRDDGDGFVRLAVSDNGIGVPPELASEIFDLFFQARTDPGPGSGLGIGLSLVRQLVGLHGGTVELVSAGRDQGSRFEVRLPRVADPGRRLAEAPAHASPQAGGRRILIVDDNVDAAEMLAALLSGAGHEVRLRYDGDGLLEAARDFRPQLILLDIGLPRRNGYELAQELTAHWDGRRDSLLVALTGWGSDADRHRARESGFDRHLTKPVAFDALQQLLDDAGGVAGP